jgi:hypothetical protein
MDSFRGAFFFGRRISLDSVGRRSQTEAKANNVLDKARFPFALRVL